MVNRLEKWSASSHTLDDNGYRTGVTQDVKYQGKPSGYVQSVSANQPTERFYVTLWQPFKADKFRGQHVEFSGVVKTLPSGNGWINPFVKVKQEDVVLQFDNMDARHIAHAKGWQKFTIVLDVPEKSTAIDIGFSVTGGGTFWLNGLAVKAVPRSTKVTSIPWDPERYQSFSWELRPFLKNADFSDVGPEAGPSEVMSWARHITDNDYAVFNDRQMQLHGKPSACIKSRVPESKDFALLYQDLSTADYRGKRVKLSAFLKTEDVADWAAIFMRVDGANNVLAFDNMEDRPVKGTTDWRQYSIVLDVPNTAKRLRVGSMLAGAGACWLNSVKLDVVGADVPVTQKARDLSKAMRDVLPDAPVLEFVR